MAKIWNTEAYILFASPKDIFIAFFLTKRGGLFYSKSTGRQPEGAAFTGRQQPQVLIIPDFEQKPALLNKIQGNIDAEIMVCYTEQ